MKFSKLLTTAMMSVALVASSSALATETSWWSMDFDGLAIEEGGTLTNALNAAYATTQNGWWTSEEGDLTTFENDKLKLNTQGTDLTWTPNADNDPTAITYIDADVTFVGSDTAPTISETDVHTAVYLKNIINDETGEVASSVLCVWARPDQVTPADWMELTGVEIKEKDENDNPTTYNLRIMLEGSNLSFFINDTPMTPVAEGVTEIWSAKDEDTAGVVDSVSFRGTGYVDNFAASQEAAAAIETATVAACGVYLDQESVSWTSENYLYVAFSEKTVQLTGDATKVASPWQVAYDNSYNEAGSLAAIKLVSDTQSFEIVYDSKTKTFSGDATLSVVENSNSDGVYFDVYVDSDELVADTQYTLELYYGEYTPSEEPDPDPVQLGTPDVTATTTETSVTLAWDAVANATGYEVTFNNGTPTTVTETTFTASNLTASTDYSYSVVAKGDGVNYTDSAAASGTATTAAAEVPAVEPDPIKISAISGPVEGNVVVTVVPATEGGKIKAGVNYWAVVSATLGGDETAQDPVTVPEDTNSLQITVPATGDSLFIKIKADTAK